MDALTLQIYVKRIFNSRTLEQIRIHHATLVQAVLKSE